MRQLERGKKEKRGVERVSHHLSQGWGGHFPTGRCVKPEKTGKSCGMYTEQEHIIIKRNTFCLKN